MNFHAENAEYVDKTLHKHDQLAITRCYPSPDSPVVVLLCVQILTMSLSPVKLRSRWPMAVCVLVSFVVGYGVSFVSRTESPPAEARIQVADFRVAIPEGDTTITITSRDPTAQQLGQLKLERRGELIAGIPVIEKRIAPRERLTID